MKRDMELVRQILLQIEEKSVDLLKPVKIDLQGRSTDEITYHLKLLSEAGLIDALDASNLRRARFLPRRLTWQGHEFLEAGRNDSIWNSALKRASGAGAGLVFSIFKELLLDEAKRRLGLSS